MDKRAVVEAFRAVLARDLDAALRMVGDTREEATGSESKAESQYDTRATEASYLAAGQGRRLVALRALGDWLAQLDPGSAHAEVAQGALVEVRRGSVVEWALVGPDGGLAATVDGVEVRMISASSPAGEVLLGKVAGDEDELDTPRGPILVKLLAVR
jgi:transcription elongation GreA/GreB family factor